MMMKADPFRWIGFHFMYVGTQHIDDYSEILRCAT